MFLCFQIYGLINVGNVFSQTLSFEFVDKWVCLKPLVWNYSSIGSMLFCHCPDHPEVNIAIWIHLGHVQTDPNR